LDINPNYPQDKAFEQVGKIFCQNLVIQEQNKTKAMFVLFFHSGMHDLLKTKIGKISSSFNANLYQLC